MIRLLPFVHSIPIVWFRWKGTLVDACYYHNFEFQALHVVHGGEHDSVFVTAVTVLEIFVWNATYMQGRLEITQPVPSWVGDGNILIVDTTLMALPL